MRLSFFGAANTVTGSKHLVEAGGQRVLLDCGLFQGFKNDRERNWAAPPFDVHTLDAVVLSHAHLDHSGWLPVLLKHGFKGPVFATAATRALCEVLLLDAAHLQEEDARRANRYGYTRHAKALPLYTRADAQRAIARIETIEPGAALAIGSVTARLVPVGHLPGACAVTLTHRGRTLAFSGDLGRSNDLLMPDPQRLQRADLMIVESTYGDRTHPNVDSGAALARIVRDTTHRGGSVLLPAFAVGRAQALLLVLQRLRRSGAIPDTLPIYVDSPMATEATELYRRYRRLLRVSSREIESLGDGVRFVATAAQSQRLVRSRWPSIIISASGMATGGRVLHHLKAMAPQAKHHIVFAGYQVGGSRGAHLLAGAPTVKIHGEQVPVRAEVSALDGLSAHADAGQILDWLRALKAPPRMCFVVHGDPEAADTLRLRIQDELRWPARVPQAGDVFDG